MQVNGSGMRFTICAIIIDFPDQITGSALNNLKSFTSPSQVDIPMGGFASRVKFVATGTFQQAPFFLQFRQRCRDIFFIEQGFIRA